MAGNDLAFPAPAGGLDDALDKALARFQAAQLAQASKAPPAATSADDPYLDRSTGAPASVRAAVGAAPSPEDRLATLRRSYPDAQPYQSSNFVFTDPKSQRRTLYNPPGLDLGDVVSLGPEVGEMVGGVGGGLLAASAAPATAGASFLAVPTGVGLGAAAGREMGIGLGRLFNGTQDNRGLLQRLGDTSLTAGANAVAGPAGEALAAGARGLLGPVARSFGANTGQQAVRDFEAVGVPLSLGATSGNAGAQQLERGVGSLPGGAPQMARVAEQQNTALGQAVERQATDLAGGAQPASAMEAGAALRQGGQAAVDRFEARQGELYDQAYNLIGAARPVDLTAVGRLGQDLASDLARAPQSRQRVLAPVMDRLARLTQDVEENGGVSFGALRNIRTDLGRELKGPANAAAPITSDNRVYMERLYGALSEDLNGTARAASPEAGQALELADRYTRFNRRLNLPAVEGILAKGTDEQAYAAAFPTNGKPDAQALGRLVRNYTPEERRALSATVLDRMGNPSPGQSSGEAFSPATFLTNWNKLTQNGPDARRALFGSDPALAEQLDRLVRVSQNLRDAGRSRNFSNTAPVALAGGLLVSAGNDAANGDFGGVLKTLGVGLIAPAAAARLITNPAFVRWMAETAPAAARGAVPESAIQSLARVGAFAPEIRREIEAVRQVLRPAPAASTTPRPLAPRS